MRQKRRLFFLRLSCSIPCLQNCNYSGFSRLIGTDITNIAKDIRENHKKDKETGEDNNPLTEVIDIVEEYATATDPMKATLTTLSKQLGMNFNKMDPAEIQFFTGIVEKYSTVYKSMLPKTGRGKKKK